MHMARTANESPFIRRIMRVGIERVLNDTEVLLMQDLTDTQRIANEEMKQRLIELKAKYSEEAKRA
jgi:hypothetical protein